MRKFTCISFLLLLLFSFAGYYLLYRVQEHRWEESMRRELVSHIPLSQLDAIDAGKNAALIEWEEEGREFYFEGHLYDVAAIKKADGKTIIYCLNDTKEEKLLEERNQASSALCEQDHQGKQAPHGFTFRLPDFIIQPGFPASFPALKQSFVFAYKTSLQTVGGTIYSPPPELTFKPNTDL